jgi:hypothetical protein
VACRLGADGEGATCVSTARSCCRRTRGAELASAGSSSVRSAATNARTSLCAWAVVPGDSRARTAAVSGERGRGVSDAKGSCSQV